MLKEIRDITTGCQACTLSKGIKHNIMSFGNEKAQVVIVVDYPFENSEGEELLFNILKASGVDIPKESLYYTYILKCRPEGTNPGATEIEACRGILEAEIAIIAPKILILLGSLAIKFFLGEEYKVSDIRGLWFKEAGMEMMGTYHPGALLRDESKKRPVWEDFKKIKIKMIEEDLI